MVHRLLQKLRLLGIAAKTAALFLVDALVLPAQTLSRRTPDSGGNVLLIRPDAIGDLVLWLGAAERFRALYREKRVTLICNIICADLAISSGLFDEVISVDREKFTRLFSMYRLRFLMMVRELTVDVAYHPVYSREFLIGDALIRVCRAQEKIGFGGDHSNIHPALRRISDRWYSRLVENKANVRTELERTALFMCSLGDTSGPSLHRLKALPLTLDFPGRDGAFFVLVPGSGAQKRCWHVENFAMLARRVVQVTGWSCLILGTASEAELCGKAAALVGERAVNMAARSGLLEYVAAVSAARLVIGNESSAIHIASAAGVPALAIVGGGHYGRFLPYPDMEGLKPVCVTLKMDCFNCNWRCRFKVEKNRPFPCLDSISVDQAKGALDVLLASLRPSSPGE